MATLKARAAESQKQISPASKVRQFADDMRDGKFVLPIGRRMPLHDAAEAHVLGEKGGIGKILLLTPDSQH
jgi:NADPH:quinone reductase-like Zn-dependent oxidoreductase